MEGNFSTRLTDQRKKKGVSQKQAASDLGISQALLSHYENGVRECGLSFVVKVANYYGVSCDYLLGNSNNELLVEGSPHITDIPEDNEVSVNTIVRASLTTASQLLGDPEMKKYVLTIYSLASYFMLCGGIKKGMLPSSWLGANSTNKYQHEYLVTTLNDTMRELGKGKPSTRKDAPPVCVSTISSWVYDYLNINIAQLM